MEVIPFCIAAVFSVSADGCFVGVCFGWGSPDSGDYRSCRLFSVLFCFLFCGCFWGSRCNSCSCGNGISVFVYDTVLFYFGRSCLEAVSGFNRFVLWERTAGFVGCLWPQLVESCYPLSVCVVDRCLFGFVLYARTFEVGVKSDFVLRKEELI